MREESRERKEKITSYEMRLNSINTEFSLMLQ